MPGKDFWRNISTTGVSQALCEVHWKSSPKNSCHTALSFCTDLLLAVSHTRTLYVKCPNWERGGSQKFLKSFYSQHFTSHPVSKTLNLNVTLLIPSYIVIHCRAKEAVLIFELKNEKMLSGLTVYMTTKVCQTRCLSPGWLSNPHSKEEAEQLQILKFPAQ